MSDEIKKSDYASPITDHDFTDHSSRITDHAPWHSELKEPGYKSPDADIRECCLAVAFGDLDALRCDVHRGDFHGRYELKINFCPHCGKDMKEYRRLVLKKLAEKYLVPGAESEEL